MARDGSVGMGGRRGLGTAQDGWVGTAGVLGTACDGMDRNDQTNALGGPGRGAGGTPTDTANHKIAWIAEIHTSTR